GRLLSVAASPPTTSAGSRCNAPIVTLARRSVSRMSVGFGRGDFALRLGRRPAKPAEDPTNACWVSLTLDPTCNAALLGHRIAPGARLLVPASQRVPVRQGFPDLLGRGLGLVPELGEIDPGDHAISH